MTADQLAAVHASCFTAPRPWTASEFDAILGSSHVFLLKQGEGFLVGRCVAAEAELLTLAVPLAERRQGHGTLLVEQFLFQSKLLGGEVAFLEVSTRNTAAIALYEALGFETVATRQDYITDLNGGQQDAFVMRCKIGHDAP